MTIEWPLFALFLTTAFAAGSTGAFFSPGSWYQGLSKPVWTPPNWLFPMAWFVLYVSMAYAAMRVAVSGHPEVAYALAIWGLQIVFNTLWSPVFFGLHRLGPALIVLFGMWASVLAMVVAFWRVDVVSGAIVAPYLVWTSFAFALNFSIWRRNPGAAQMAGV